MQENTTGSNADKLIIAKQIILPSGMQDLSVVSKNLLDMLETVKKNPLQVEQAKAMAQVGNVIVNVAKTQIDQIRAVIEYSEFANK